MILGYARVSTKDQSLDSQIAELKNLGAQRIYSDKASGKDQSRTNFKKLLEDIREGDTLLVIKIDRLGRNLKDLILLFDIFGQKSIKVKAGSLDLDFTTAEGRMFAHLFASFAEFERELIRERTMIGLKNAKAQGRIGGKPPGLSSEAKQKAKHAYELREKGLKVTELLAAAKISNRATLYKYIRYHAKYLVSITPGTELSEDGLSVITK